MGVYFGKARLEFIPEVGSLVDARNVDPLAGLDNFLTGAPRHHHQMGQLLRYVLQKGANRKAIHLRHVDIDDENVRIISTGFDQGLESVGRGFDLETHQGASIGDCPQDTGIVVGNKHPWRHLVSFELIHRAHLQSERPVVRFLTQDRTVDATSDQEIRTWLMQHWERQYSVSINQKLTNAALRAGCVRIRNRLPARPIYSDLLS
jgi:hypothetical protein